MQWVDEALILDIGKYAEHAAIVHVFSREHGRYSGISKAALSSRNRASYQPGNLVQAVWKARLAEHMGTVSCELVQSLAAYVMQDALRLSAITSVCALVKLCLPERDPHPGLYDTVRMLALQIAHDDDADWLVAYARFELLLLQECGVGLDLGECAATGRQDDLCYVSPKSGRAVSREAGEPYKERMLPLPAFLILPDASAGKGEVMDSLRLTGHFLVHGWGEAHHQQIPASRDRFMAILQKG